MVAYSRTSEIRDRILDYLHQVGEISDRGGRASSRLREAIGCDLSGTAFAQLLGTMERAGEIQRVVRGKRTYRIIEGGLSSTNRSSELQSPVDRDVVDYEKLALTLLHRVTQTLAQQEQPSGSPAAGVSRRLERTMRSLEHKAAEAQQALIKITSERDALAQTNAELEERIAAASRTIEVLHNQVLARGSAASVRLDAGDRELLRKLSGLSQPDSDAVG